ncbi:MAG: cupin domain-containing protein [Deltaproteobacteria bacterium]|nr:cupin domain-containing protein [Deltaproteobacteria bacterium]
MEKSNLFNLPDPLPETERFEALIPDRGILIERIVSVGHATPGDEWYDQGRDEWVALLQGRAELEFDDGRKVRMSAGDHALIPAHEKHRVTWTSSNPPCIWLAVHGNLR